MCSVYFCGALAFWPVSCVRDVSTYRIRLQDVKSNKTLRLCMCCFIFATFGIMADGVPSHLPLALRLRRALSAPCGTVPPRQPPPLLPKTLFPSLPIWPISSLPVSLPPTQALQAIIWTLTLKADTFAFLLLFLCYLFIAMKEKENLFLFTALFIRL